MKEFGRAEAVRRYREYLLTTPGLLDAAPVAGRQRTFAVVPER